MTADNFTTAARAEAERRYIENDPDYPDRGTAIARVAAFAVGAEWGHEQALAQEPADAECIAVSWTDCDCDWETKYCDENHRRTTRIPRSALTRAALSAARAVRIAR